jgi:hypothetical protein
VIAQILASTTEHMLHIPRYEAGLWNCFICRNDSPRGSNCQFCTACACFDCGAIGKLEAQSCGDELCAGCVKNREQDAGERAEQELFTSYWEGTAPDYVYEAMAQRVAS